MKESVLANRMLVLWQSGYDAATVIVGSIRRLLLVFKRSWSLCWRKPPCRPPGSAWQSSLWSWLSSGLAEHPGAWMEKSRPNELSGCFYSQISLMVNFASAGWLHINLWITASWFWHDHQYTHEKSSPSSSRLYVAISASSFILMLRRASYSCVCTMMLLRSCVSSASRPRRTPLRDSISML